MTDLHLKARDGFRLSATAYTAHRPVKRKVMIVNAAAGAPRRAYDAFAIAMAGAGYPVVTYDYRGTGASRPESLRGFDANFADWAEKDMPGVIDWVDGAYPGFAKILLGHRLGGVLAAAYPDLGKISAMLGVGLAEEYWRNRRGFQRMIFYARWRLVTPINTALLGYQPSWPFAVRYDLPKGVARDRARLGLRKGHVFADPALHAADRAAELRGPLLIARLQGDRRAPPAATAAILRGFANASISYWDIDPALVGRKARARLGFFDPAVAQPLWPKVIEWLEALR